MALVACGDGDSPSDGRAPPTGPFAVGTALLELIDESRTTRVNGSAPEKPFRRLVTRLYYPASGDPGGNEVLDAPAAVLDGPYPLIVFAHGLTGIPEVYREVLVGWARAGYVVAAPTFPLTNAFTEGGASSSDIVNQPADMSFVIDEMLRLSASSHPALGGMIDAERIGAAGQSLGGMTTLGVTRNSCCVDSRIRAAVPMAARLVPFPSGAFDSALRIPTLLIHGDADDTVPYSDARGALDALSPPKALVTILGGDHIIPYVAGANRPETLPNREASLAFFDHYLKSLPDALDRLRAVGDLPNAEVELVLD